MVRQEQPWKETTPNEVIPDKVIQSYFRKHYVKA